MSQERVAKTIVGLELFTGVAGLIGGLLLVARPDGSLLHAEPSALTGSPFVDWRMPGVLLAGLVGGGFLLTFVWQWQRRPFAGALSGLAGIGLVAFEATEWAWIGFQPLEAVFGVIGLAIAALAGRSGRRPSDRA